MITDTHAHVWWSSFDADREQVFERAQAAGVSRMVLVGTDLASSRMAFELARSRPWVHPTAGMHPHDASQLDPSARETIAELCARPECVAVGESGLDWFKEFSPRAAQLAAFDWHAGLAVELNKPLIIHCREAHADLVPALDRHPGLRAVMHCYSMGSAELPAYLERGLYISFSGSVTYPRNTANQEAARAVPEDRLLVETDCPFLAPQSHRGRRNEPAFVRETLEFLARSRGTSWEVLAERTSANAQALFGWS